MPIAGLHAIIEESLYELCSYCKAPHEADLREEFYLNFHYKSGTCKKCEHKIMIAQH